MVYSINDDVVFGTVFTVPSYPTPTIKDIFGNDISMYDAISESTDNRNRDSLISTLNEKIIRNTELGCIILSQFREYTIIQGNLLGIPIDGIEHLKSLNFIALALLCGMLSEAGTLISQIPSDVIITDEIKTKFTNACNSANHMS